jgi:hypothetical protein
MLLRAAVLIGSPLLLTDFRLTPKGKIPRGERKKEIGEEQASGRWQGRE